MRYSIKEKLAPIPENPATDLAIEAEEKLENGESIDSSVDNGQFVTQVHVSQVGDEGTDDNNKNEEGTNENPLTIMTNATKEVNRSKDIEIGSAEEAAKTTDVALDIPENDNQTGMKTEDAEANDETDNKERKHSAGSSDESSTSPLWGKKEKVRICMIVVIVLIILGILVAVIAIYFAGKFISIYCIEK